MSTDSDRPDPNPSPDFSDATGITDEQAMGGIAPKSTEGLISDLREGLGVGSLVSVGHFDPNKAIDDINLPFGALAEDFDPASQSHLVLVELDLELRPIYGDSEWMMLDAAEVEAVLGVIPDFNPESATDVTESLIHSVQWGEGVSWDAVRYEKAEPDSLIPDAELPSTPSPSS